MGGLCANTNFFIKILIIIKNIFLVNQRRAKTVDIIFEGEI